MPEFPIVDLTKDMTRDSSKFSDLPLPNQTFGAATVIASVWVNDDPETPDTPLSALLILLLDSPPFYRVVEIVLRNGRWLVHSENAHPNIVPAVEEYQQMGGDY